ncbi:hypothetical protein ACF0H5_010108 [Mactra antiquata]
MRMETFGKEVKKTGFLEGTKFWKIRTRTIVVVVTIYAGILCGAVRYVSNKDSINERKKKYFGSEVDPDLEKRVAFYEQLKLSHDTEKK